MQQRVSLLFILAFALSIGFTTSPVIAQDADPAEAAAPDDQAAGEGDESADAESDTAEEPPAPVEWTAKEVNGKRKSAYISWLRMLPVLLLVLLWTATGDWVNRSSQIHGLGYGTWNLVAFFPFVVAMAVFVAVPSYVVGLSALTLAWLGPFIAYALKHNKTVDRHLKVFTGDWFRYTIAEWGNKVGLKLSHERQADYEKGAKVDLDAVGGDEKENKANLITARQSPGYLLVKELIADMADRRSERLVLDYTQQGVGVKHLIDGMWHEGEARERDSGDVMLAVMKQLANLDITERRKKQEGKFAAKYDGIQYLCSFASQGVATGERVLMELVGGAQAKLLSYSDLGMREKIRNQWEALMARDVGLLVVAAPPEGGLTTLTDVSIVETDRLMRDFVTVDDASNPPREIENVAAHTFDSTKDESPATVLPQLVRTYPNVYIVRDIVDRDSAKILFSEVHEDHLVITTVPALEAPEALLRLLQKKVPHKDFASLVTAVLCTRLIRKLCDNCKVEYAPSPDLLQKLGIPQGKVEKLYRVPTAEEQDKPCPKCGGMGYIGRTGLFELLVVNDKVREVLIKQPKIELLRKAARLAGMRTFQEEAILLVAKGVTSLQEAQRVLKGS